ncbi:hypothetical protein [uncultured Maribacter sp.]|uniref:hypothetical protein n=1 Tax=uncultured Maribacter sp. TaxID=431308 RepID=UPI0030D97842
MKAIIFFILFTILTIPTVFGQIKIGDNPQNIDPASVLELESSSKVLVITRVSTQEMEAITPQRGGIVYNTDSECINYYDGTQWVNLCDAVNFTITNDPIINNRATIEITQTAGGYNLEIAKNGILGDNIVDGGIGPDDIQDNSITQEKLAAESVGSSEIRQNSVGTDEIRDGSIAPTDMANFIPGQVLVTDENGIVQWGDAGDLTGALGDEITITGNGTPANPLEITEGIQLNISNNTALITEHIIDDQDTDDTNELIDLTFNELTKKLTISQSATPGGTSVDLSVLNNSGTDDQTITQFNLNPTTKVLTLTLENGGTRTVPLQSLSESNTDSQTLSITNDILEISGGNSIPLTDYINTDSQQLRINGNQLSISGTGGNTITLPDIDPTNELQNIGQVLLDGNDGGGKIIKNIGDPVDPQDAVTLSYFNTNNIGNQNASQVAYDPTASGLAGATAQAAIDELAGSTLVNTDNQNAAQVAYDNTASGLTAITTQAAIDEIVANPVVETDNQNLESAILTGSDLAINIEDGNNVTADLSELTTDLELAAAITASENADDDKSDTNEIQAITSTDGSVTITNTDNDFNLSVTSGQNITNANLNLNDDRTVGLAGNDLYFTGAGLIGIGTITPSNKLHVAGAIRAEGIRNTFGTLPSSVAYSFNDDSNTGMYRAGPDQLGLVTTGVEALRIDAAQNVGIGPTFEVDGTTIAARLHVDGDVLFEGNVTVTGTHTGIPDYVFQKYFTGLSELKDSYNFKNLEEIEQFLIKNNHLPGIKSAKQVKEDGLWSLSESNLQNLEKIEELFLHTIEQEKKIKKLESSNKNMASEVQALKAQMEEIKNLLLEKTKE